LLHLWGTVDPKALAATIAPFTRAGSTLVLSGRRASALAASRYYAQFRAVEGVDGSVLVTTAAPPDASVVEGNLRGAGLRGIANAFRAGRPADEAARNGFVRLAGSATNIVLGGGRDTLMGAIQSDPQARGWQRVTDGDPCAFCAMVASKGIIAGDEASAGFEAHGHCGCTAEPAFEGTPVRPDNERLARAWKDATKGLSGTDALNAFRRHLAGAEGDA
jgi:hypothetical protein